MQRSVIDNFEFAMALEQYAMTSEDLKEALAAIREKRAGNYKNR